MINSTKNIIATNKDKMNKLLKSSRTTKKNSVTHISMGEIRGKYTLNMKKISKLFELASTHRGYQGIAEIPQVYSMLRFDFDFQDFHNFRFKKRCKVLVYH